MPEGVLTVAARARKSCKIPSRVEVRPSIHTAGTDRSSGAIRKPSRGKSSGSCPPVSACRTVRHIVFGTPWECHGALKRGKSRFITRFITEIVRFHDSCGSRSDSRRESDTPDRDGITKRRHRLEHQHTIIHSERKHLLRARESQQVVAPPDKTLSGDIFTPIQPLPPRPQPPPASVAANTSLPQQSGPP